ncbi:MAG: hypothetical protein QF380_08715, partial [Candidatus Marinimicrobia bacterium]|nr:hypothetical protein [Candidatus Neomarinimicrobiota bacterium]
WDWTLCTGGVCDVPVMGESLENEPWTAGYMEEGEIPSFKIFDASANGGSGAYYDAVADQDIPWMNLGMNVILDLNVVPDCNGDLGGTAWESDCGCVEEGNSGDDCDDCAGIPNGSATIQTYWVDADGDGLGSGSGSEFCDATVPLGWVLNNADINDDIFCYSNIIDECDVCDGENADMDCAGECFGDHWESDCGCVEEGNSGDDCDDC